MMGFNFSLALHRVGTWIINRVVIIRNKAFNEGCGKVRPNQTIMHELLHDNVHTTNHIHDFENSPSVAYYPVVT